MMRVLVIVTIVACGGSQPPPPQPPAVPPVTQTLPPPATPITEPNKPAGCENAPNLHEHAKDTFDCAIAKLAAKDWQMAATLCSGVKERYPYSKYAVLCEELLADAEAGNEQWDDAAKSYELFLKFHPTHEHVPDVQRKLTEAKAHVP